MQHKKERLLTKDYIAVMFAAMGTAFVNYFFLSTLTQYAEKLTNTVLYGGMLVTVYSMAALAVRPVSGVLSDKFGRTKLLIAGSFVCALACFAYGFTTAIFALLVIRAIHGVGFGVHSTCAGAVVADVVPKSRMAEGIGYFGMYAVFAQALAPAIAKAIVGNGDVANYRPLFFVSAALCAFSTLCNCMLTYERKNPKPERLSRQKTPDVKSQDLSHLPKTFMGFEYAVFPPVLVLIFIYFGLTSVMNFIILFGDWRGFDSIALYYTFSAAGVFISRFFFGKIADRHGFDIVIIPGFALMAILIAIIPMTQSITGLVLIAFPLGLAQGAALPCVNSMMFKRCSPARRGSASAAYFVAIDIGFSIGAIILGAIADATDYRFIYWAGAALVTIGFLLYLIIASDSSYNKRLAKREATQHHQIA